MSDFLILGCGCRMVCRIAVRSKLRNDSAGRIRRSPGVGIREGLLERQEDRLVLTPQGTLLSNELFEKLL